MLLLSLSRLNTYTSHLKIMSFSKEILTQNIIIFGIGITTILILKMWTLTKSIDVSWVFIGRNDTEAETPNTLATWYEELTYLKRR